jgi:hypothetical protein
VQNLDPKDKPTLNFLNDFFTEQQLADELGRTVRTLRRWHELRLGPPRTVCGRLILYRKTSAAEWLRAREEQLSRVCLGERRRKP